MRENFGKSPLVPSDVIWMRRTSTYLPALLHQDFKHPNFSLLPIVNKTKVLSVQLGKTFSFVKFVVEWGQRARCKGARLTAKKKKGTS